MALAAKNMARGNVGRSWMAVRDMDVAAEVIGIRLMRAKLLAFAVSSFYCGVAGALFAYAYLGTVEPEAFNLDLSFRILFMVIIGGVGTVLGSFLGSAFVTLLPVLLSVTVRFLDSNLGLHIAESTISNLELMVFGGAHHLLPDRRAARTRAAVADRQGEAAAVAVPALSPVLSRWRRPRGAVPCGLCGSGRPRLDRGGRGKPAVSYVDSSRRSDMKAMKSALLGIALLAAAAAASAQNEQFIPVLSYRVGPVRGRRLRLLRRRDRLLDARQHDRRRQRREAACGRSARPSTTRRRASSATSG